MLTHIFDQERTQSIINVMPDNMIVWKVVTHWRYSTIFLEANKQGMENNLWHPAFTFSTGNNKNKQKNWYPFKSGCNENNIWGFHCFIKKINAQQYKEYFKNKTQIGHWNMLSAKINKKDIMKIGLDRGLSLTILTSRIIMPTYPNLEITKEIAENCDLIESCEQSMKLISNNCLLNVPSPKG